MVSSTLIKPNTNTNQTSAADPPSGGQAGDGPPSVHGVGGEFSSWDQETTESKSEVPKTPTLPKEESSGSAEEKILRAGRELSRLNPKELFDSKIEWAIPAFVKLFSSDLHLRRGLAAEDVLAAVKDLQAEYERKQKGPEKSRIQDRTAVLIHRLGKEHGDDVCNLLSCKLSFPDRDPVARLRSAHAASRRDAGLFHEVHCSVCGKPHSNKIDKASQKWKYHGPCLKPCCEDESCRAGTLEQRLAAMEALRRNRDAAVSDYIKMRIADELDRLRRALRNEEQDDPPSARLIDEWDHPDIQQIWHSELTSDKPVNRLTLSDGLGTKAA